MKTVLVTGATGCVGSNLIIELLRKGYDVRAFRRPHSNTDALNGIDVPHIIGDILDRETLFNAMDKCDTVFHTAALVTFWKGKRKEQFDINVNGTRNVVEACLSTGIRKLVHTSTIAALGYRTDGELIKETTQYNWGTRYGYRYTKFLAEGEILRGVEKGLNATIVNPSIIIGPRDINAHGGALIRVLKRGRIPFSLDGGINLVSVHDVIAGHIAAALGGRSGERYILGGTNFTYGELFSLGARLFGGKEPLRKVPVWLVKGIACLFDLLGGITGREPPFTSDLAAAAGLYNWYSIEKAERELDYRTTSLEDAMREACNWFAEHGMV